MRSLRVIFLGAIASGAIAGSAAAEEPYLYDLLKQPAFHAAWDAMLKGEKNRPAWIVTFGRTYDGVTDRVKTVLVNGDPDHLGWVCKPHDCGDNQLYVLFSPQGRQAWAELVTANAPPRWFGKPDEQVKTALEAAAKDH